MAKIKKTKVDGALVYPATIFPAVKDPNTGQTLTDKLAELGSKLIKIKGFMNPSSDTNNPQIGDVYYIVDESSANYRKLRKRANFVDNTYVFETVPYIEGAVYTYDNDLYVWNGVELVSKTKELTEELAIQTIELKGIGQTFNDVVGIGIGEYYYNVKEKVIKRCESYSNGQAKFVVIPFVKGAVYKLYDSLYVWNGENLVDFRKLSMANVLSLWGLREVKKNLSKGDLVNVGIVGYAGYETEPNYGHSDPIDINSGDVLVITGGGKNLPYYVEVDEEGNVTKISDYSIGADKVVIFEFKENTKIVVNGRKTMWSSKASLDFSAVIFVPTLENKLSGLFTSEEKVISNDEIKNSDKVLVDGHDVGVHNPTVGTAIQLLQAGSAKTLRLPIEADYTIEYPMFKTSSNGGCAITDDSGIILGAYINTDKETGTYNTIVAPNGSRWFYFYYSGSLQSIDIYITIKAKSKIDRLQDNVQQLQDNVQQLPIADIYKYIDAADVSGSGYYNSLGNFVADSLYGVTKPIHVGKGRFVLFEGCGSNIPYYVITDANGNFLQLGPISVSAADRKYVEFTEDTYIVINGRIGAWTNPLSLPFKAVVMSSVLAKDRIDNIEKQINSFVGKSNATDEEAVARFEKAMHDKCLSLGIQGAQIGSPAGYGPLLTGDYTYIPTWGVVKIMAAAIGYEELMNIWGHDSRIIRTNDIEEDIPIQSTLAKSAYAKSLTNYYTVLGWKTGTALPLTNLAVVCTCAELDGKLLCGMISRTDPASSGDREGNNRYIAMKILMDIGMERYKNREVDVSAFEEQLAAQGVTSAAVAVLPNGNPRLLHHMDIASNPYTRLYSYQESDVNTMSMVKMVTAMTALDFISNLDERTTITRSDINGGANGSGMIFTVGQSVTYRDLLYALMLPSSNQAAYAIARVVGHKLLAVYRGDSFIE